MRNGKAKEILKRCKGEGEHSSIRMLSLLLIVILLISTATRTISLYRIFNIICPKGDIEENILDTLIRDNNHQMFNMLIHDGYDVASREDKISTMKLEKDLINNHTKTELNDMLNSTKFSNKIFDTMDNANKKYYKSSDAENTNFLIIGTEENILYAKANSYHDKFKNLLGKNSTITWDTFYNKLNNPKMTKKVFNNLKVSPNGDAVIMRIDGKYDKDQIYNSKDLIKIFKEKGIDGLKGFGYVTLSTITEDGDILGHSDSIFMQQNLECKKIYVYHYMDIREYILNNTDKLVEQNVKDAYYIDTIDKEVINDFLFSISTIIFNIISIIGLMFIYKLLEEDSE